jgi:hypothetical protein
MSSTDLSGCTNAAIPSPLDGRSLPPGSGGEQTSVQGTVAINGALAKDSRPSRLVASLRVGPARKVHPQSFNDPCNYLG